MEHNSWWSIACLISIATDLQYWLKYKNYVYIKNKTLNRYPKPKSIHPIFIYSWGGKKCIIIGTNDFFETQHFISSD